MSPASPGLEIAKSISPSLAKRTVAMVRDGELADLADPIDRDAKLEFIARDDPRALELIRHDAAHVLAEAVQSLWPGTQVTIGPVIENGFYYDFFRNEPFTPEDFPAIEKRMREIIARDKPFSKRVVSREEAKSLFEKKGEAFKIELVDAIPADQEVKLYSQGEWTDLCRGPHMTSTGKVGDAFKLMKVAGAYWRGDSTRPMLSRIYATAFAKKEELDAYLKQLEEAEKRDHRKLAREMDLFHTQEEGPGSIFWHPKGWTLVPDPGRLHAPASRRRLSGGQRAAGARQAPVGDLRALGLVSREHVHVPPGRRRGRDRGSARLCAEAHELPGPCADLQARPALLSRAAAAFRRVRRGQPLRAVGGAARPHARALVHAGRRAYLLHRGADGGGVSQDQRTDPVGLRPFRLRQDRGETLDPARKAGRNRRHVGPRGGGDDPRAGRDPARHGNVVTTALNPGEGAFYGPKFEYVLRDAIGRDWQCGTTQVDFNLPERFGAFYIAGNSEKTTPVMIHRAICGSMERFIGILLEHHAGHLPLWLAPVQIVVCTITSDADDAALEFAAAAKKRGLQSRDRPAQREDQLQSARALVGESSRSHRARTQGSERKHRVRAPPRLQCARPRWASRRRSTALAGEAVPPDLRG